MMYPAFLLAALFAFLIAEPGAARGWTGGLALVLVFSVIWSFERTRELMRKPYLIPGYMYSNQIIGGEIPAKGVGSELDALGEKGILKTAAFVPKELRTVTPANRLQAGRVIALLECSACHTFQEKGLRPLPERVRRLGASSPDDVDAVLGSLGAIPYMPPFAGTDAERRALAEYLFALSKS
jgi:mono/diheme cytochrome c family protein